MIKQTGMVVTALALCLAAGCNRGGGNNAAAANKAVANAATPAPAANAATPAPAASQVRLELAPGGLDAIEGTRRSPLAFGSPIATAVTGLTTMFGAPMEDATNSDCGGGPMRIVRWSNGLRVVAQNDQLKGWEINQPGINALGDLHVGTTRAQLEANQASFEQTTLGTEWTVGDGDQTVSGLLSDNTPNGTVTAMWAGDTCHMT